MATFGGPDGLTYAQRKVLRVIDGYIAEHGYPPTLREIGEAIGVASSSTVHYHLDGLEGRGWIRRTPGRPRTLVLVRRVPETAPGGGSVAL